MIQQLHFQVYIHRKLCTQVHCSIIYNCHGIGNSYCFLPQMNGLKNVIDD